MCVGGLAFNAANMSRKSDLASMCSTKMIIKLINRQGGMEVFSKSEYLELRKRNSEIIKHPE